MSNLTDFIKYELYPALFNYIPQAFPERNFQRIRGGWGSKTYLNGAPHKSRQDKTVITESKPGRMFEQGAGSLSLVDCVMERDRVDILGAVEYLSSIAGLQVPKGKDYDPEAYNKQRDQANIFETLNNYFTYLLLEDKGKDEGRDKLLDYLQGRGYSKEYIKAMELGYCPDKKRIRAGLGKILQDPKYNDLIEETLTEKLHNKGIGETHILSIPYRSGGEIKGFKFRSIAEEITPKYLNSKGLDKIGGFFNISGIKGDKDLVIVEGELDSLHASTKGAGSIVGTGGNSINSEQVKDAIKRGARSFTICFDNEPAKEQETVNKINRAIEVILAEGINRVYTVTLPDLGNKTDPDRLIKEQGIEAFKNAIAQAEPYYLYRLQAALHKYDKIQQERGSLTPKEQDSLLEEVVETAATIKEPVDKDRYLNEFTSLEAVKELGISRESIEATVETLSYKKDKEAQATELKKLLSEATQELNKGETGKALELLETNKIREVKLKDKTTQYGALLVPAKRGEISKNLQDRPEGLKTGYTISEEELLLPSGAISIIAGATSHGKTTLLINLALNIAQEYSEKKSNKKVYFFGYEEDREALMIRFLNTYIGETLNKNNRRTLKGYLAHGTTQYIEGKGGMFNEKVKLLEDKTKKFFSELIEPGRLAPVYASYNSDELIEAIRYLHKNTEIGAVFIDYIQLLNPPQGKRKAYSRQEEVKQVCIDLNELAVETGLPLILGAQFRREVKNIARLHPTQLGEAGDIERVANLLIGIWDNKFQNIDTKPSEEGEIVRIETALGKLTEDRLYIKILKNREGEAGLEGLLDYDHNTGKINNPKEDKNRRKF